MGSYLRNRRNGWVVAIAAVAMMIPAGLSAAPEKPAVADTADSGGQASLSRAQRLQRLIEQLGHAEYAVRQRAQEELARWGFDAFEELSAAATHPDLEVSSRARYLLRLVRVQWTSENDPPAVKKVLSNYELQTPTIRLKKIERLAAMPDDIGIPALCRLVRFEKSPVLARFAALHILRREPAEETARARRADALKAQLGASRQPAAEWLLTFLRLRQNLDAARPEWNKLIEAEESVLRRTPQQSSPELVTGLVYQLAIVERDLDRKEAANATARRAREMSFSTRAAASGFHRTAYALRERGLFDWAEAEYRRVIDSGNPLERVWANVGLSEMLHDQGQHLRAAEARQAVVQAVEQGRLRNADLDDIGMTLPEIRARMNYLFACHWQERGDPEKHRKHLEDAFHADPTEVDTLIACYRLPDPKPAQRRRVIEMIQKSAAELRTEIDDLQPDNELAQDQLATDCNQFAWLIGNTEGNYDEALAMAQKSLEINPYNGAFCDTIARVYFAKGDLGNAVKYQTMAHRLDPHSGLIAKQLRQFQEAQAQKGAAQKKAPGSGTPVPAKEKPGRTGGS